MKIQFDEIIVGSRNRNIDIYDGEKNVIINKKDFDRVKTIEGAIPISENCRDLNSLKIKSVKNSYKVSFTEDQQHRAVHGITEIPSIPFAELQTYNFDPNKKYRVHINQDCMNNAGSYGYDSPLPTFLKSKTNIVEAAIDNDVTSIGNDAFYYCDSLTSITIPDGVTSIGDSAFAYCSSLKSINIPDGVTSISGWAFHGCSGLTSVTIGNGVTEISYNAFNGCSGLTSINIPNSVTAIGNYAFAYCSSLKSINISDGVTSIGKEAFNSCYSLTSVTIGNSVTSIGYNAFGSCSSLTEITIPNSVTSISNYAFLGCSSLTEITYTGTQVQWNAIHGLSTSDIPSGCIIHCTDGDITIQ